MADTEELLPEAAEAIRIATQDLNVGTKNKPGRYDCYQNAEPDEPMFILLARDPCAAGLVLKWAEWREQLIRDGKKPVSDREMIREAWACAEAMNAWRKANRP